ncbi:hypothetical protein DFH28DRAFT_933296 [Melampsora americana]|nr:hypothetical protein DFH28DRAFT_933296 [Melampsora americana]
MSEVKSRIGHPKSNELITNQDLQAKYRNTSNYKTNLTYPNPRGFLNLPIEIINLIAIQLCRNSSNTQTSIQTFQRRKNRSSFRILEFKDLFQLGMSCKTLHLICQRIYQKQLVINLPIIKRNHIPNHSKSLINMRDESRRRCKEEEEELILETIKELDRISKERKGIETLTWVYITNQTYQRLNESHHFLPLISSSKRLINSFQNLRYLCLDKINDEMILIYLEKDGINSNLESLTINLSQPDHTTQTDHFQDFDQRIQNIKSLKNLKALQINDIQPTWIKLINQTNSLQSLCLHISEFSSILITELDEKPSIKSLEILGGLRSPESSKRLLLAITEKFSKIESFKFGMHFRYQYDEDEKILKLDSSNLISKLTELKHFIFNHADAPIPLNFLLNSNDQNQKEMEEIQFKRIFDYSKSYFEKCHRLEELISFDFSDRFTNTGIMVKKSKRQDFNLSEIDQIQVGDDERCKSRDGNEGRRQKWMRFNLEHGSGHSIPILIYKINQIKESFLLPFESHWTRLCD